MKQYLKFLLVLFLFCAVPSACEKGSDDCGYHNGNKLYLGPKGGCYYINSNGNKTYVDRSECQC